MNDIEKEMEALANDIINDHIHKFKQHIASLEMMNNHDAELTVALIIDMYDVHIRQITYTKARLREYLQNRKSNTQSLSGTIN